MTSTRPIRRPKRRRLSDCLSDDPVGMRAHPSSRSIGSRSGTQLNGAVPRDVLQNQVADGNCNGAVAHGDLQESSSALGRPEVLIDGSLHEPGGLVGAGEPVTHQAMKKEGFDVNVRSSGRRDELMAGSSSSLLYEGLNNWKADLVIEEAALHKLNHKHFLQSVKTKLQIQQEDDQPSLDLQSQEPFVWFPV